MKDKKIDYCGKGIYEQIKNIKPTEATQFSIKDFEEDLYRCRVKYLSAEDIVDLGFVKTKEYSDEIVFQKNISDYEFIELTFHLDDDYNITVEKWNQSKMAAKKLPINEINWQSYTIFRGVIKNKSKLKEVLQMVGVL